ncbi:hypothetical protein CDD82_3034 [Ophiocordyceps australis]|uniref:Tetratricopeptide repeat protein 1 (TTC1) n=1 Tax=Ophiocordyceps australis TaxID=1399860 RepID=A0A2C5ZH02_9HYPO|nr:hypothetical protein CDD82_3034 [Ophiocordyceps australis]
MDEPTSQAKDASSSQPKSPEPPHDEHEHPELLRFSPDEEAALLQESQSIKAEANALFSSKDYNTALARYHDSVASCPKYLRYHHAVLQSNIAACHLKLEQWNDAIKTASDAIDSLLQYEKQAVSPVAQASSDATTTTAPSNHSILTSTSGAADNAPVASHHVEHVIVSPGAANSAPPSSRPTTDPTKADIARIRTKALLRRARARSEAGGWQNLAGAQDDYRTLADMPSLSPADMHIVRTQLQSLPPRTKAAQDAETTEMWGKLRQLGDGILKPFGLTTNNFQMVKDEKTGGYSVNFNQQGGGKASSS